MPSNYDFSEADVFDELPPLPGGEIRKTSPLMRNVDALQKVGGKWKPVASYDDRAKASASCVTLRRRYGDRADVYGYEFAARPDADGRWVVLGKFDADKVSATGPADWEQRKVERAQKWHATHNQNQAQHNN